MVENNGDDSNSTSRTSRTLVEDMADDPSLSWGSPVLKIRRKIAGGATVATGLSQQQHDANTITTLARVFETEDYQAILEEAGCQEQFGNDAQTKQLKLRRTKDASSGVYILRCIYATLIVFWTGFLFVFSVQVLLLVLVHLTLVMKNDNGGVDWGLGNILRTQR